MSTNTIIQQGSFTGTGNNVTLQIRSGFDWIRVINLTALTQAAANLNCVFEWQAGMANGGGIAWEKLGAVGNDPVTIGALAANTGFFTIDSTVNRLGPSIAVTNITNANPPVMTVGSTATLPTGSVIRFYNSTIASSLNGYDLLVTQINGTTFNTPTFANAPATVGGADATASLRLVNFPPVYYPPFRTIVNITRAAQAVVSLSAPSGYQVGQEIIFRIPSSNWGMTEIDGLVGTITAVSDASPTPTVTVNIDSTAFTAFVFPTQLSAWRRERAVVAPVGIDTGYTLFTQVPAGNILNDATYNTNFVGVTLVGGAASPGGAAADSMFWMAGKSFSVNGM